jgi:hypothetical protein
MNTHDRGRRFLIGRWSPSSRGFELRVLGRPAKRPAPRAAQILRAVDADGNLLPLAND